MQTTSPLIARKSFWTVVTTIEAAGLTTAPYHAHVPSFGEWGFIVASRRPFRLAAARCRRACASSPSPACRRCSTSRPTWRACPAEVNRLSNQVLVQTFEDEWGKVQR